MPVSSSTTRILRGFMISERPIFGSRDAEAQRKTNHAFLYAPSPLRQEHASSYVGRRGSGFDGFCFGGDDGDFQDEPGARGLIVLYANVAAMFRHNMAYDGKAQSGSAIFGGKVGQEQLLLVVGTDSRSRV